MYDRLLELEEMAKAAKRGVHSPKEAPVARTNDVSLPGSAARAKQYLPHFQRAGRMAAVVEYASSGHRLKIHIPREVRDGVCTDLSSMYWSCLRCTGPV